MRVVQYQPFTLANLFEHPFKTSSGSPAYPSLVGNEADVDQNEKEVRLSLDLPGVKLSDLNVQVEADGTVLVKGVRKVGPKKETTVEKVFSLDPETTELSEVQASLEDGVLTLIAPKKVKPEPTKVAIVTKNDDDMSDKLMESSSDDKNEMRFFMDVPGLKSSDLDISVEQDGTVSISGSRKVTSSDGKVVKQYKISKRFLVDSETTELDQMKAHLADGVLTLVAPKKPKAAPHKIQVTASNQSNANTKPTPTLKTTEEMKTT